MNRKDRDVGAGMRLTERTRKCLDMSAYFVKTEVGFYRAL